MKRAGKTIIVVGSGPGGTTAAALLASRGFDVTLFEKQKIIGGRCGSIQQAGYRFDIGPTFLMMKFLLDLVFEEAQARSADYLNFTELDPMYELRLHGRSFCPSSDPDKTRAEVEKLFPGKGASFDRFRQGEKERFAHLLPCIQRDYSSFWKLFSVDLMKSVPYLGMGQSVFDVLNGYFKEEDLALLFAFQSKYLGMSAWRCPGGFSMLSYIEHAFGVYHVEGGLAEIPLALARLAEQHGAKIRLETPVRRLILDGKKVKGVELDDGEKVYADEVVLNADFAQAMVDLVPDGVLKKYTPETLDKKQFSCSTFMMHLGLKKLYPSHHHTILFADKYRQNVEEVFEQHRLSEQLSFYVRNASVTDKTLAPNGKSSVYVLIPVPNLDGKIDWQIEQPRLRSYILQQLEKQLGWQGVEAQIEVEKCITPIDWRQQLDIYKGATFNLAHNYSQLAYWRPRNKFEELDNCYLVGGGTHPGSGLPTILESARIGANMISRKYDVPFITKEVVL